jgi:hypothetical protein
MSDVIVSITDQITLLKQAVTKENFMYQNDLVTLSTDFYKNIIEAINQTEDKNINLSALQQLREKRKMKLTMIAMSTIPLTQIEKKLTEDELEFFRKIRSANTEHESFGCM